MQLSERFSERHELLDHSDRLAPQDAAFELPCQRHNEPARPLDGISRQPWSIRGTIPEMPEASFSASISAAKRANVVSLSLLRTFMAQSGDPGFDTRHTVPLPPPPISSSSCQSPSLSPAWRFAA